MFERFLGSVSPNAWPSSRGSRGNRCRPARSIAIARSATACCASRCDRSTGVRDVLEGLTIPYCIASSGDLDKMRVTLGATKLLPLFDGRFYSATEVPRGKPAPDMFLLAAQRMGAAPRALRRHRGFRQRRASGLRCRHDGVRVQRTHGAGEAHRRRCRARVVPHARVAGAAGLSRALTGPDARSRCRCPARAAHLRCVTAQHPVEAEPAACRRCRYTSASTASASSSIARPCRAARSTATAVAIDAAHRPDSEA